MAMIIFNAFLSTLEQAHQRFGLQVLCYCLMSNYYHLLVKTPEANLGRAMRHINGQYTQAYNRLRKTDGSLFRGRYKAILVEQDSYQLQLCEQTIGFGLAITGNLPAARREIAPTRKIPGIC